MLQKLSKRKSSGFTIIEVMIVLAIAGLILLIVFLAVPALQRNAHNTSIKNDVAGLLGGVSEYINNNNGSMPTGISNASVNSLDIGTNGTNVATVKVGYIDGTTITLTKLNGSIGAPATAGQAKLYTNAICDPAVTGGAKSNGATARNFVALYTLEGGAKQCQAS
jgi:prepilin-type N-terminal cleavage/methylation domain-containing protein